MIVKFFILLVISFFGCCLGDCGLESCNDLKTVKECQNVQKCITEVWSKQTPTGQRDDVCEICLKMVKEARDQLMSNETRSDIKAVLDGSCDLLRIKPIVVECRKLADEFVPELVAMLSSQMDPEVVCSVAKLCNNKRYNNKQKGSKECSDCLTFVYAAEDFIENIPEDKFKSEMVQMCRSMGSYSDACFYYTPLFSDFYYNQTKYALKKQPCEVLGACPKGSSFPLSPRESSWKEAKIKMCSMCPSVMVNLKSRILTESLADFKLQVYKTCRSLALFKNSCARILDGYYPKLYKYMTQKFNPIEFCKEKFVFCSQQEEDLFAWPLFPVTFDSQPNFEDFLSQSGVLDIVVAGEGAEGNAPAPEPRITLSVGDPMDHKGPLLGLTKEDSTCGECVKMFHFITNLIERDPDYLKKVLRIVCKESSNPEKCLNFLESYCKEIKDILLYNFNAENMCPELVPRCKADSKVFQDSEPSREAACSFCLKGFHSLNEGLKKTEILPDVEKALIPMCRPVPEESLAICENFVKTLTLIAAKASEIDTCSHLRLCPEPELPVQAVEVVKEKPSCKICLLVVQTVYDQVQDKSNEEEIRKVLEGLCSELPEKLRGPCNVMVITYTDEIVQMITDNLKPEEVCDKLHFCHDTTIAVSTTEPATPPQKTELKGWGKIPCNFCLTAIRMLMDQLQNNKTEEAIQHAITGLCNYMPEETRDTCRTLIDQYTEDIIDMIIADFNANEICTYLKICGPHLKTFAFVPNFGVATNELRDRYNPVETCDMCKFMAAKRNDDKAADALLALLVDICITDPRHQYEECKMLLREKVLPYGKIAFADFDDVCGELKICPLEKKAAEMELLQKMRNAVQECAMCETLAQVIAGHKNMLQDGYDFSKHAPLICSTVPRNKKSQCESMLVSYGPSIVNLLTNGTRIEDVCYRVVLCDENQQAKLRMPVSVVELSESNECLQGPEFWCKNVENAKKCGTLPHCQITVWKDGKAPEQTL